MIAFQSDMIQLSHTIPIFILVFRSQRSIPGSFEGYEEENIVIEYERGDERGRAPEKQEQRDTTQEPREKEVVMKESYWTEVTERFNRMSEKKKKQKNRYLEEELRAKLLYAEEMLQEEQTRTKDLQKELDGTPSATTPLGLIVDPGPAGQR